LIEDGYDLFSKDNLQLACLYHICEDIT
jgi:hypothetical protein